MRDCSSESSVNGIAESEKQTEVADWLWSGAGRHRRRSRRCRWKARTELPKILCEAGSRERRAGNNVEARSDADGPQPMARGGRGASVGFAHYRSANRSGR